MTTPLVVGIAGGSAAGKSTVARYLLSVLGSDSVAALDLDSYYRDFAEVSSEERRGINWDHPSSVDLAEFSEHLRALRRGEAVRKPAYSFAKYSREGVFETVVPAPLILVEGLFLFLDAELREMIDMKVYVDLDPDLRFIRRLQRDTMHRGRQASDVIEQYLSSVRPMHLEFVEPSKQWADLILPASSSAGLEMLALSLQARLALSQ